MHLCCGPCTAYPLTVLRDEGITVEGFFYNPNIHPFKEFQKRLNALEIVSEKMGLQVDYIREYGLQEYLRHVVFHENDRCAICYDIRLVATVLHAKGIGADAFTTTLLYSRYQKHDLICKKAEKLSKKYNIPFYYQDFREGWEQGIEMSKEMDLYRQPYCGCIYSEQERYDKQFRNKQKKALKP